MQRLAILRRRGKDGSVQDVAVNPQSVDYVIEQEDGAYITFSHEHSEDFDNEDSEAVTPIGIMSPDRFETVRKQLDKPYKVDMALRIIGMLVGWLLATITIAATILLNQPS